MAHPYPRSHSPRRRPRRLLSAGAALAVAACAPDRPPNVVIVFTDDQGYADVGVYGAVGFTTPHIDRLAAEGMRFTDFYASQAVCSASRASLLTGSYAERVSVQGALMPWAEVGLHPEEETIADLLKARGYATGMVGKWHLGHHEAFLPARQGFDEYLGLPYSNDMWPVNFDGTPAHEGNKADYPPLPLIDGTETVAIVEDLAGQATLTARYAERAVDFIGRHADRPFFLYVAHSMPHVPLGVSDRFAGHSAQGMYGDVIEEIDWSVGEILDALDRHGLAENTLVFFTSDNGPWLNFGNHAGSTGPLREGKGTAFEGGPRVPAIARWPGRIPAGAVSSRLASTIDLLPTIVAATGTDPPDRPIDGVNLLPLLEGDATVTPRNDLLFYYGGELRAVREGRWKRVYRHRTRSYVGVEPGHDGYPGPYAFPTVPDALYDLEADIGETTDVAAAHPEVVARLDALADSARASLGDGLTGIVGRDVRPPGRLRFDRPDSVGHAAVGARVTLTAAPDAAYPGDGASSLTDGVVGSRDVRDGRWLGFHGSDLEAVVDLGTARAITRVGIDVLQAPRAWIFYPRAVAFAVSDDGATWRTIHDAEIPVSGDTEPAVRRVEAPADVGPVRYLRVRARNLGANPPWHAAAGEPAWLFADEIVVR